MNETQFYDIFESNVLIESNSSLSEWKPGYPLPFVKWSLPSLSELRGFGAEPLTTAHQLFPVRRYKPSTQELKHLQVWGEVTGKLQLQPGKKNAATDQFFKVKTW